MTNKPALGAIGAVALALTQALAGGGPENVLIIADPTRPTSLHAANYYRQARNVPPQNVLYMDPDAQNYAAFTAANLPALLGSLDQRAIADHIDYILVMPGGQYRVGAVGYVSDPCSSVTWFSISACYSSAFIADGILAGGTRHNESNRYFGLFTDIPAFDSNTGYVSGSPSTSEFAKRYFIGSLLGYTSTELGNTLDEIFDMVDRSVAADGTRPDGTFYFMNNTADVARNVRATQYSSTLSLLDSAGATGEIISGTLPLTRHDCLGVMSGFATQNVDGADMTLLPGSFCEHLTSFGALFDPSTQTKASEWIRKGASGSYGAVQEPCNYIGKFPRANFHVAYAQGMTLGESAFRSLAFFPFQGLIYGDPLTRPFAHIPAVSVPDAPSSPVSGVVTLTPQATTTHPTATIESFELFIDGVSVATTGPSGAFSIDTTQLAEGPHDVRVLAYDSTTIRTVGRWLAALDVDNTPRHATLSVNNATGGLTTAFEFTVSASGAPIDEIRLWHNGRIVGSSMTTAAPISVRGRAFGAGPVSVWIEAVFADAATARSAPIDLDITDAAPTAAASPTAFSYSRTVSPASPFVLELPASFVDDIADASWSITTSPAQASFLNNSGPYRVLNPDPGATGADLIQFQVTTPSGSSAIASINLTYALPPCPADLAAPIGELDFSDILAFLSAFAAGAPEADLAPPFGSFDFSDVLAFLSAFAAGCP